MELDWETIGDLIINLCLDHMGMKSLENLSRGTNREKDIEKIIQRVEFIFSLDDNEFEIVQECIEND